MNRNIRVQVWVLFSILLANFAAQIVYFFHLYYTPQHPLPEARSVLILGAVFALFLTSYILLLKRHKAGIYAMAFYLSVEFFFYLWNFVENGLRPGLGWFFHLREPDPVLWMVFAIGYLSFFASGYFLALVLIQSRDMI